MVEGKWDALGIFPSTIAGQIVGAHYYVTPKHVNRYVSENAWRFNLRDIGEGWRVNALLASANAV